MPNTKFFPSVSDLLPLENIPDNLGVFKDGLQNIFGQIYYKDLQVEKSVLGDAAFYKLSLIAYNRIGLKVPGTEISIVLNPDDVGQNISDIPITLSYKLEILKHINAFNVAGFSDSPRAFFDLFLDIADLTEQEILEEVIAVFIDDVDPFQKFVDDFNTNHSTTNPVLDLNPPTNLTLIEHLVAQIEANNIDVFEVLFDDFINNLNTPSEILSNIKELFKKWLGEVGFDDIKKMFIPQVSMGIGAVSVGVEFPTSWFRQVDPLTKEPLGNGIDVPSILAFNLGSINYGTESGLVFGGINNASISFPESEILRTGLTIGFTNMKIDFSRTENIAEAIADGRPNDFMGVFVEQAIIGLPPFIKNDSANPNPNPSAIFIAGRNLLIGTGGISGTIGLETTGPGLCKTLGDKFQICFNSFDLTLQQNAIIGSNIEGTMKIPGFKDTTGTDAEINIDIHIGQDGDFSVTASENQGITALRIPDILDFNIDSLTIGREDNRFFVAVSGEVDFHDQNANNNSSFIGKFLPDKIEIQKLIIWEDGDIELEGGTIVLPNAVSLKLGPVELSITAIGMGSHEQMHSGLLRKYKFFEFAGGLSIGPAGVDARGDGIKFYFTTDNNNLPNGDPNQRKLHVFVRIQSIAIDLIIPGDAKPEDAALLLSGFLSMKEPASTNSNPDAGTEYAGGVSFTLPKVKMGGSAAMRINPKVPAFLVDVGLEMSTPIPLGSTGLGIYGFRGLVGKRYVASKGAANVLPDAPWWQYYKAKVADEYREGIQTGKFDQTNGFSLGAGISLATASDSGKVFSSKIFFLLALPEVFLLQGQGQLLKERIGLDNTTDPPFFAMLAISKTSVEAAFGVDYKIPDDGSIAKVAGIIEMGFFFGNSSSWYLNVGRDFPIERRIQARLLDIFNVYFYMMISSSGIRAGAGASFEVSKKFGPLKAELGAYLDVAGRIQFVPKQIGGSIQLGGHVGLKIFKYGFSISFQAGLAAEAPIPFIVTGSVKVCVKVLWKKYCAKFNLTWNKNGNLNFTPISIIDTSVASKALNMLTNETFDLLALNTLPSSGQISVLNNFVIPMDSYIDIEFLKGVLPASGISSLIGGNSQGARYIDFSAPQRGKSPRVRHQYHLNSISIKTWSGTSWINYDIYDVATPLIDAPFVTSNLASLKSGYWQYQHPNLYNKLRIMAQTPLDFLSQGSGDVIIEDLGIGMEDIFCPPEEIPKCCINLDGIRLNPKNPEVTIPANELRFFEKFLFRITDNDGHIVIHPFENFTNALALSENNQIEFFFNEPIACFNILMQTLADTVTINYFVLETLANAYNSQGELLLPDEHGAAQSQYVLIKSTTLTKAQLDNIAIVKYEEINDPIDKIVIETGSCNSDLPIVCDAGITEEGRYLQEFLSTLAKNEHLTINNNLWPTGSSIYNNVFQFTPLYTGSIKKATIDTIVTNITKSVLDFTINDNLGFSCDIHLELADPKVTSIDFRNIFSFENLREDSANLVSGQNFNFLIDGWIKAGSGIQKITFKGTSCYNIINCQEGCSTFIYEICFLNLSDAMFNATLPTIVDLQNEIDDMVEGFEKSIQPIWRPDSYIAIELNTTNRMFIEGSGSQSSSQTQNHVFAFKTEGPIGHFHQHDPRYNTLLANDKEDEFKLSGLKHYIDYTKSFPNADGNVLNAKPLFYVDPQLVLFYKKDYVYEMFRGWDTIAGSSVHPTTEAELEVIIKDPAPDTSVSPNLPITAVWGRNNIAPILPNGLNALNNMVENGSPCVIVNPIEPFDVNPVFPLFELKPLKLYSAIFNAKFNKVGDSIPTEVNEVHRYVFQTSRYRNFEEQINSYQLLIDDINGNILKKAVFDVKISLTTPELTIAKAVFGDTLHPNDSLRQDFALVYDRLIDGVLKLGAFNPAVTTEFNVIRDITTDNIYGILIRNPEPFNDPKLPESELQTTIQLSVTPKTPPNVPPPLPVAYKVLFSKDRRNAFVSTANNSLNVGTGAHEYVFEFRLFNGQDYTTVSSVTVNLTINSLL